MKVANSKLLTDIIAELKGWGARYVSKEELFQSCDIISLHTPLLPSTRHILNDQAFKQMKRGVMIINTGRGALIDSQALLNALHAVSVIGIVLSVTRELWALQGWMFMKERQPISLRTSLRK